MPRNVGPRDPEVVERSLRAFLRREEKRWRVRRRDALLADVVESAGLSREAMKGKYLITPASAQKAREMLGLEWADVEELSGVYAGAVMAFEANGRRSTAQVRTLQAAYETEGLVFSADGGVTWKE